MAGSTTQGTPAYQWVLAWLIVIGLLAVTSQTALGHVLIYYTLLLFLLFLVLTQYQFIAQSLAPIGQPVSATS